MSVSETLKSKLDTTNLAAPIWPRSPPVKAAAAPAPALRPPSNKSCFHELFTSPWNWIVGCWLGLCFLHHQIMNRPQKSDRSSWKIGYKVQTTEEPLTASESATLRLLGLYSAQLGGSKINFDCLKRRSSKNSRKEASKTLVRVAVDPSGRLFKQNVHFRRCHFEKWLTKSNKS